jgi:A/G-specific adenine glycosylase
MLTHSFSGPLTEWYHTHKRDLPWRKTNDPYKIWVSEIMLQQTRVDTVIPYYNRFLDAFPTVHDLADASQQQVLKLWEGLGYYSRGRNLHHAAQQVVNEYGGAVPSTYKEITSLKGIGPYTASAILSIAFQKKYAVVDGNVVRVVTRFNAIETDIRKSSVKKDVQNFMDEAVPDSNPGDFNQAVMELGATVCTPSNPICSSCPLQMECQAWNTAQTDTIPYKSPAKKVPHHQIAVGIIVNENNEVLIALRPQDSMLGGLWEFPGGKQEKKESLEDTLRRELREELDVETEIFSKFKQLKHAYSHFKITMHAFWCKIKKGTPKPRSSDEIKWVQLSNIDQFPFPKANKSIIKDLHSLKKQSLQDYLNHAG